MGPLRFCHHTFAAWGLLMREAGTFVRLSWLCVAVSVFALAVSPRHPAAGSLVDIAARGIFVTAWMRFVAFGERPEGVAPFHLGRRQVLVALGWLLADIFVTLPAHVMGSSLAISTGTPLPALMPGLLLVVHALLGAAYLLPAEAALEPETSAGWRLPDMALKGGLAAGVAVALAWFPGTLVPIVTGLLPAGEVVEGLSIADTAALVIRYVLMALISGTVALIWRDLSSRR